MADYTPSTTFNFGSVSTYTPSTTFDWTVDDGLVQGSFSVTLADTTSDFVAHVRIEGSFDVTLDDTVANFVGFILPQGSFDVTLDDATADFVGKNIANLGIFQNIQLDDVVGGIIAEYDPNVNRLTIHESLNIYEDATNLPPQITCFPSEQASPEPLETESVYENTSQLNIDTAFVAENGTPFNLATEFVYEEATWFTDKTCITWEQGTRTEISKESVCQQATFADTKFGVVLEQMTKVYPWRWQVIYEGADVQYDFIHPVMRDPLPPWDYKPDWDNVDAEFVDDGFTPDGNFEFNFGIPDSLALEHKFGIYHVEFRSGLEDSKILNKEKCVIVEEAKQPDRGKTPWVDLPLDPVDPDPPGGGGEIYIVPTQEVYTMQNTLLVTLDDDLTEIHMSTVNLSLDRDSYTWQFSGDLIDPSQIALITQVAGVSKILHITINSEVWHVLVEKISISRVFGNKSVSISGRGLTALIGKPYVQPTSVNYGTTLTVQNIVNNIMPLNWNNQGDLYWLLGDDPIGSPVDWSVDGGAYSYSGKTPIEALSELAQNIGTFILPSRDSQEIYFKDTYNVLPWNFASVVVDVQIPDSAIISLTQEPVANWQGQGVYVHGNEIGGELALVRLNGVADPRLVPTVSNGLMTDVKALEWLGRRILAGQAEQPIIKSITTVMDGTIVPFVDVGTFIGFDVDGVVTKGMVNAVSVSAKWGESLEVSQTLTIGEQTPNTWAAFKDLLPVDPIVIGEITSTDGTTSLMLLVDGGIIRVRGTGNVGGKYWIDSQHIIDSAPNMIALTDITV